MVYFIASLRLDLSIRRYPYFYVGLLLSVKYNFQWRREEGRVRAAAQAVLCMGRHLRGENSEFWRLHCNMLA